MILLVLVFIEIQLLFQIQIYIQMHNLKLFLNRFGQWCCSFSIDILTESEFSQLDNQAAELVNGTHNFRDTNLLQECAIIIL